MRELAKFVVLQLGLIGMAIAIGFTRSLNARIVRGAFRDWRAGKGSIFDLMADHAKIIIAGISPHCGTYRKDTFVKDVAGPFMARFSKPPTPRALNIWSDGNEIAVLADADGTTLDGMPYLNNYVFVFKMRHGRIDQAIEFLDMAAFNDVWDRVKPAPVGSAEAL